MSNFVRVDNDGKTQYINMDMVTDIYYKEKDNTTVVNFSGIGLRTFKGNIAEELATEAAEKND